MASSFRKVLFDLEYEILKEHSKRQVVKIGTWVGNDRKRFATLMELFLHGDFLITQRTAWMVNYCAEHHPELIEGWLPALLEKTQEKGVHDAVPRNVFRILGFVDVPRSVLGMAVSLSFQYISNPSIPIAVKANAMYVLANAAEKEPGLIHEIEEALLHIPDQSAGIRACVSKVMKKLGRIKKNRKE